MTDTLLALSTDHCRITPLTADDARALAAITSFFTVPSMGVHPDKAQHRLGDTEAIFSWLRHSRIMKGPPLRPT